MASWNSTSKEGDQPPSTAPYHHISTTNSQYQQPIVPSNYAHATSRSSLAQTGYVPSNANTQIPAGTYSKSAAFNANMTQSGLQQPTPGSLAALEQMYSQQQRSSQSPDMSILAAPTFAVQPPQPYINANLGAEIYNLATPMEFPGTATSSSNLGYAPAYSLIDQNMLAVAGPSSAYSTPPTFYDSDAAWSFDSTGQEVQSSSSSTRGVQPIHTSSRERLPESKPGSTTAEATYDCPVEGCNKSFNRSYNYRAHMETHSANRVYPFDCPVENCDKRFRRKTDLQRHHLSVHEKARDHQCELCGRCFSRKDTLGRHRDDGCSRRFETSFELGVEPAGNENDEN